MVERRLLFRVDPGESLQRKMSATAQRRRLRKSSTVHIPRNILFGLRAFLFTKDRRRDDGGKHQPILSHRSLSALCLALEKRRSKALPQDQP